MKPGWMFLILLVVIAINLLIWVPALNDCNAIGGQLVMNVFKLPVCIK